MNANGAMRVRGDGAARVTSFELFFDLVYVFAVTQLSHSLLEHLTVKGAAQTLLLLLAVWWAWMYTCWTTNYFDPEHPAVRIMLVGLMLGSLVMSTFLPEAFGERAIWFAGAYAALQLGRTVFVVIYSRGDPLNDTYRRVLVWHTLTGALWIAGALIGGPTQAVLWVVALLLEYAGPMHGYTTPGLGRSQTSDWTIDGAHMAERCQLFVIIALGESILVTGATVGKLGPSGGTIAAFVVAFVGSVALWWIYFDRTAEAAAEAIAESDDPGKLGRNAYTYLHIPMVAGIIVMAVGDELVIAHPGGHTSLGTAVAVLGGPALYLAGHALFTRAVFGRVPWARLIAIGLLVLLIPLAFVVAPLVLASLTTLILVVLALAKNVDGKLANH